MLILPEGYRAKLDIRQTEAAIKMLKDYFERELAQALRLMRVSAPLFVYPQSGLNDNLSGVERPVSFTTKETPDRPLEIVHSLAKWKRMALKRYGFGVGEGLYTDMNAIRRDEDTDNLHSIYVDQWDWEVIIDEQRRNMSTLQDLVQRIYHVFKKTERFITAAFPQLSVQLPEKITFLSAQQLEDRYPNLTSKEREDAAVRAHGAVFISQIGGALRSGQIHDGRAPDYDDWRLNGDIVFYNPLLDCAFELSSMGIRVNREALLSQLREAGCPERAQLDFQRQLLAGALPQTAGGGIGQSRLCMFFLNKAHIGEVQVSAWPEQELEDCRQAGIELL
nr:aspartate--ammonia ligase [Maliibacterium massiliense]